MKRELPPDPEDLIYGEKSFVMGADAHNLALEMFILRNEGQEITVQALANGMKRSRSTLYRKFGQKRLKAMIQAFANGDASVYQEYFQRTATASDRSKDDQNEEDLDKTRSETTRLTRQGQTHAARGNATSPAPRAPQRGHSASQNDRSDLFRAPHPFPYSSPSSKAHDFAKVP